MPEEIAERFAADTATHSMKVLRDDGLYKHLRFTGTRPNKDTGEPERSPFYWFDLVTWPGTLAINGDCGSYLFSRDTDMLAFFRGHNINPQYWAEKVPASIRGSLRCYSEDKFRQLIKEQLAADAEVGGPETDWPGVTEAAIEQIFGDNSQWYTYAEDGARAALDEFEFGATWMGTCICGAVQGGFTSDDDAYRWCRTHGPDGTFHSAKKVDKFDGFTFTDTWEWDLRDWDWQYLWCCHAIIFGIAQHDQRPAEPASEMAASNA